MNHINNNKKVHRNRVRLIMSSSVLIPGLSVAFLWGVGPVISKFLLSDQDISSKTLIVIGGIVYFVCVMAYSTYVWKDIHADLKKMSHKNLLIIVIQAFVTGFVANIIYMAALKKHKSYVVSALIYAAPVFTLVCSILFLSERITMYGFLGVIMIVAGTTLLAFNEPLVDEFRID